MLNPCLLHTRGTAPGGRSAAFAVRGPVTHEKPSLPTFSVPQVGLCDMGMIISPLTGLNDMMCVEGPSSQQLATAVTNTKPRAGAAARARACAHASVQACGPQAWSAGGRVGG